ncbi:MAG: diguanylate cyclase [Gemmatimonadetes bacterium]|nr:diguanylate cyclase [Gemmatimonadota bacterium]
MRKLLNRVLADSVQRPVRYGARCCAVSYRTRGAAANPPGPLISPLIPADDFARQLSYEELAAHAGSAALSSHVAICSAVAEGLGVVRRDFGEARAAMLLRELILFVRRNLRGSDAMSCKDDELVLLLDASAMPAAAIAERLLAAVRAHVFSPSGADHPHRFTLSLGIATAPEHGTSFPALLTAARQARLTAGNDGAARAFSARSNVLDLSRFVGRAEPLAQLTDYLDDMVRGVGRVVAIVGESGVGTSALVRTLAPEVRLRGGSLVVGSAREHRFAAPYALWNEVLRGIRRLPVKSTRQWRELPALDPTLEPVPGDTARGGSKTHLLEELADFLRLAAQQRPLVILLRNLQWVDAASWDALEYLITQLESERILLALTFRTGVEDDGLERWSRLSSRPRHSQIALTHLTRDDVKRWLESAMRTDELGRDLLAYVYRHSEGNPLMLTHLLRDLQEGGHIVSHEGSWQWGAVSDLPPAATLDDLISRRIARLPEGARAVLEAAAVLARESEEGLLLDSALHVPEARHGLERLLESGMLVPTYDRGRASYVVSHDEVARITKARLTPRRSVELHGRIARALAAQERSSSAEIAGHFEVANNRIEAHRYALQAADEAMLVHENIAVADLLAGAERNAPSDEALADVRVRMAALAEVAGRFDEAEALCERALTWHESREDSVHALPLKRMRVRVRMQRGQAARETLEALFALEQEARDVGADAERAAILLLISQTHWRLGDLRAAQRVAAECVVIAEQGTDAILIADSCNRLAVTIQLENGARARELFTRSLEIATAAGDAFRRVRVLNNIGVLELISNNWDEARRMLTLAADQARTAHLVDHWGRAELNLGVLAGRMGDHEGAARALAEALRLTSMVQNSEEQLYATYNLAHLERERLRFREAADTYSLVTDLAERIGQVEVQAGAIAGVGLCRFLLGDLSAARASFERAVPLMERLVEWFQGRELMEALTIHLLLTDNRDTEASACFEKALFAAGPSDVYGGAWLTAEFGEVFKRHLPAEIEAAVREYARRPEILGNPRMRERLGALKLDS